MEKTRPTPFLACSYAAVCAGCDYLYVSADHQREMKTEALMHELREAVPGFRFPEVKWISISAGGLRDRVDLMIDRRSGERRIGLFDRFRTGLVDLQGCPQLSVDLEAWLGDFRRVDIPIERGSIRLRVSPKGMRGVWLDFANTDIKALLDERTVLESLREIAIVEIGQKRKRLSEVDGRLKLLDPVLEPWFETYVADKDRALYCTIGSFTQPGFRANRALVSEVTRLLDRVNASRAAEFGTGIGNFTLPLAARCERVDAFEVDTLALEGLKRSLVEQGLSEKVEIHSGNFQGTKAEALSFADVDLLLVDPPRSGLMQFLDPLESAEKSRRPQSFIYVSCFAESFARDTKRLIAMGYALTDLSIVDQFPQSRHFEAVALFERMG